MAFVRRRVEGLTTATPVTIGTVGGGNAGVGRGGAVVGGDFLEYDLDGHRSAKGGHGERPGE